MLEKRYIIDAVILRVADLIDEAAYCFGGVAPATHAGDGGHTRIIPSGDNLLLHQLQQLALAHYRVGEVETIELILAGTVITLRQLVDKPVVERTVHHELERAERVRHSLEVIRLPMGKVIHRISLPGCAGAV